MRGFGNHGPSAADHASGVVGIDSASDAEMASNFKSCIQNERKGGTEPDPRPSHRGGSSAGILDDVSPGCWGEGFTKSG